MSKKILITSGPTRAPLDAVRFLTNRSTGRFGTLLAFEALRRGGRVTFVYGEGSEAPLPQPRLRLVPIETNKDLEEVLRRELRRRYDAVIHAMAVLDFRPSTMRRGKVSSTRSWRLTLVPTSKVIRQIKRWSPKSLVVGFKLEADRGGRQPIHRLLTRGRRLVKEAGADLVLANWLTEGEDLTHFGCLIARDGSVVDRGRGKSVLARKVIRRVLEALER